MICGALSVVRRAAIYSLACFSGGKVEYIQKNTSAPSPAPRRATCDATPCVARPGTRRLPRAPVHRHDLSFTGLSEKFC